MKKMFTLLFAAALTFSFASCDRPNKESRETDTKEEGNTGAGIGATGTSNESGSTGSGLESDTGTLGSSPTDTVRNQR